MKEFWTEGLPPGYYDQILKKGIEKNRGIQSNWHNMTFKKMRSKIRKESLHLDYACGPGTFIGLYGLKNSKGMDISEEQIKFANNEYGHLGKFEVVKPQTLSNIKDEYDVITVIGLLEFINDEEILTIIENLSRALKQNGRILFTTPNYGGMMLFLEKLLNFFGDVNYKNQHINRFTKQNLEKILKKSNLKLVKVEKFLNFGVFLSFFSFNLGIKFDKLIENIFNNYFGFLLFAEVVKE